MSGGRRSLATTEAASTEARVPVKARTASVSLRALSCMYLRYSRRSSTPSGCARSSSRTLEKPTSAFSRELMKWLCSALGTPASAGACGRLTTRRSRSWPSSSNLRTCSISSFWAWISAASAVRRVTQSVASLFDCSVSWAWRSRSEEHTSELQSQSNLVCRLLLEKKKTNQYLAFHSTSKKTE